MPIDTEEARTLLVDEQARLQQIRTSLTLEPVDGLGEREALSELSFADQHPADVATETFEREKDVSILEQLEEELAELQAALERIDKGTYGVDEVTGKPIAPERLEARPTARTNVDTEGQREADGRLPHGGAGDPEEY
jgi:RNA polymerase-binding transcription factor DksA